MIYATKILSFMAIKFLFSRSRLFSFLNFMKARRNVTKAILREA